MTRPYTASERNNSELYQPQWTDRNDDYVFSASRQWPSADAVHSNISIGEGGRELGISCSWLGEHRVEWFSKDVCVHSVTPTVNTVCHRAQRGGNQCGLHGANLHCSIAPRLSLKASLLSGTAVL